MKINWLSFLSCSLGIFYYFLTIFNSTLHIHKIKRCFFYFMLYCLKFVAYWVQWCKFLVRFKNANMFIALTCSGGWSNNNWTISYINNVLKYCVQIMGLSPQFLALLLLALLLGLWHVLFHLTSHLVYCLSIGFILLWISACRCFFFMYAYTWDPIHLIFLFWNRGERKVQ